MVSGLSCRGLVAEVGLLSVAATACGPGFYAANMSHTKCGGFLCGPLNSLVGSAKEHATVVSAGCVAWRRACNKGCTSAQIEVRFNCELYL
jgi:hypothetical protein